MRCLIVLAMLVSSWFGIPSTATASHRTPLYQAAHTYREAVRDFERAVIRARYFNHYDKRLVDRLEDATSSLRSAARRPNRLDRLIFTWNEVESLQPRVEAMIFDPARYPPNPQLAHCWNAVVCAGAQFSQQLTFLHVPSSFHTAPVILYRDGMVPTQVLPAARPDVARPAHNDDRGHSILIPPSDASPESAR